MNDFFGNLIARAKGREASIKPASRSVFAADSASWTLDESPSELSNQVDTSDEISRDSGDTDNGDDSFGALPTVAGPTVQEAPMTAQKRVVPWHKEKVKEREQSRNDPSNHEVKGDESNPRTSVGETSALEFSVFTETIGESQTDESEQPSPLGTSDANSSRSGPLHFAKRQIDHLSLDDSLLVTQRSAAVEPPEQASGFWSGDTAKASQDAAMVRPNDASTAAPERFRRTQSEHKITLPEAGASNAVSDGVGQETSPSPVPRGRPSRLEGADLSEQNDRFDSSRHVPDKEVPTDRSALPRLVEPDSQAVAEPGLDLERSLHAAAQAVSPPSISVEVTIGHMEVIAPARREATVRRVPSRPVPAVSLSDYLRQRQGGRG